MKKLSLFLACLAFSIGTRAQGVNIETIHKHQISAGVGFLSSTTLLNGLYTVFGDIVYNLVSPTAERDNMRGGSSYLLSYKYQPLNWLAVGATFAYTPIKYDIDKTNSGEKIGNQNFNYYTFALEGTVYYMSTKTVRLYGMLGAAVTTGKSIQKDNNGTVLEKDHGSAPNFQITPLGVSVGHKFGGFAELGFGYRGLLALGIYYRP